MSYLETHAWKINTSPESSDCEDGGKGEIWTHVSLTQVRPNTTGFNCFVICA